jgi:hypothetical protein
MRISTRSFVKTCALLAFVAVVASCGGIGGGGGGGGSSANYEGEFYLELERDHIDSGDLNRITVEVSNLNPAGSVLKFRISRSLRFVANSAVFFPGRDERRIVSPEVLDSTPYERYVVFFLDPREAIDGDYVSLQFTLRAVAGDEDGFIELDLDNNDPTIADSREFSANNAKFTAKERRSIYIEPDSSVPTATPTAAASGTPGASSTPTPAPTAQSSSNSRE